MFERVDFAPPRSFLPVTETNVQLMGELILRRELNRGISWIFSNHAVKNTEPGRPRAGAAQRLISETRGATTVPRRRLVCAVFRAY